MKQGQLIKSRIILQALAMLMIFIACQKDHDNTPKDNKIEWMKVLTDTVSDSFDDEMDIGRNGKVLTDNDDNIYLFYYNSNNEETHVIKYLADGTTVWKKTISEFGASDMVLLNDGSIVLSGTDPDHSYKWNMFYAIRSNGSVDSLFMTPGLYNLGNESWSMNSTMTALPDDGIIVSTVTQLRYTNTLPLSYMGSILKISPSFTEEWRRALKNYSYSIERLSQNSVLPVGNGKYLYEFALTTDKNYTDYSYHGFTSGLVNSDGSLDTSYNNISGYTVTSSGQKSGVLNRYCNRLMDDGNGNYIFHYSSPVSFTGQPPAIPNGFIRIGNDARIKDTIPIDLPPDYRIFSCTQGNGRFLLSAYKSNVVQGTNDYLAGQTLFLSGGSDWRVTNRFTVQNSYSDFFFSSAPTTDGGLIIMGKIQSFNGRNNKLTLVKYRKF